MTAKKGAVSGNGDDMTGHLESDIGCAAYLYASGFELLDLVPVGSRYSFRFDDPDGKIQAASRDYFRGGTVGAKQLVEALKHLKDLLYAEKKGGNGNGHRNFGQ